MKDNKFLRSVSITNNNFQNMQSASITFNESPITGCLNDLVVVHNNIKTYDHFNDANVTVTYSKDLLASIFSGNFFDAITLNDTDDVDFRFVYTDNDVYKYTDNETNKTYYVTIYPDSYRVISADEKAEMDNHDTEAPQDEKVNDSCPNNVITAVNNDSSMHSLKSIIMNDIAKYNSKKADEFDITPLIDYVSQCVIYGKYDFVAVDNNSDMWFIEPTDERESNDNIIGVAITTDDMSFFDYRERIEKHLCSNELFDFSSADIVACDDNKVRIILYV